MKTIKFTEQIHVLGTTFKDIYEIAHYCRNEIPNVIISATIIGFVALYLQNQKMRLKTNWKN